MSKRFMEFIFNRFMSGSTTSAACGMRGKKMEILEFRDEYIRLGQALKAAGLVQSGVEAKFAVLDGLVKVNGQTQTQRGKKLHEGDIVEFQGNQIKIQVGNER